MRYTTRMTIVTGKQVSVSCRMSISFLPMGILTARDPNGKAKWRTGRGGTYLDKLFHAINTQQDEMAAQSRVDDFNSKTLA